MSCVEPWPEAFNFGLNGLRPVRGVPTFIDDGGVVTYGELDA